jgi:hypothetical protein
LKTPSGKTAGNIALFPFNCMSYNKHYSSPSKGEESSLVKYKYS